LSSATRSASEPRKSGGKPPHSTQLRPSAIEHVIGFHFEGIWQGNSVARESKNRLAE
jgi:hypothetical protein